MASREKLTESIRTLLTERGLGDIAPKLLSGIDELVMMSQYHGVDIEAEVEHRINELNTKQSTRKDDMELVQLTNKIITGIELLAEDYNAVPGCPDYAKKLRRMSKVLAKPEAIIDKVLRKDIGEEWKAVKAHPTYKISNFGRVIGRNGKVLSTYIDCYGREIVDPQTENGKHKHLHIRAAVINAFIHPKKGEKVKYMHGQKVNTVYNLGIV
jgi:hypothetical protein